MPKKLSEQIFTRIFPLGVSQLVRVATRVSPASPPSGLDHVYTNKPEKCSEVHTEFAGGSDHRIIKITRYCKSLQNNARYVTKRSFKEFCPSKFCEAVKNLSWFDLYRHQICKPTS